MNQETKILEKCNLFCSTSKGQVLVYDIMVIIRANELPFVEHANTRLNYNPFRISKEYFNLEKLSKKEYFKISKERILDTRQKIASEVIWQKLNQMEKFRFSFEAHKDTLTTLTFL